MKKWVPTIFLFAGIVSLIIAGALWNSEVSPRADIIDHTVPLSCTISGLIMHQQSCPVDGDAAQPCMMVIPTYSFSYDSESYVGVMVAAPSLTPDVYTNTNVNDTAAILTHYQDARGLWMKQTCYAQYDTDDQHSNTIDVSTLTLIAPDHATYTNWRNVMAFFFATSAVTILASIATCVYVRRQKRLQVPS